MSGLRYADESQREREFVDMTSLTVQEFDQLVPSFEEAFQQRMKEYRLDGKKRLGRGFTSYCNCPLPTTEDRLLFILVYLKTNALQVAHGRLFGLRQNVRGIPRSPAKGSLPCAIPLAERIAKNLLVKVQGGRVLTGHQH